MTRLLFFGPLRDVAGGSERSVDIPDDVSNSAALIDWLCADDKDLGDALRGGGVRIAVDQKVADAGAPIAGAKEIAFLPPFSGG